MVDNSQDRKLARRTNTNQAATYPFCSSNFHNPLSFISPSGKDLVNAPDPAIDYDRETVSTSCKPDCQSRIK